MTSGDNIACASSFSSFSTSGRPLRWLSRGGVLGGVTIPVLAPSFCFSFSSFFSTLTSAFSSTAGTTGELPALAGRAAPGAT